MKPVPLRVLLVEERPSDAARIVAELRRAGFAPDWQRVETEAAFAAGLQPDLELILAEYALPHFDALKALRRLRRRGLDIPVIVVTASQGEEAAVQCLKQGAADYLLKDRLARLGPAVTHALREKQLREAQRRADQIQAVLFQVAQAANLSANLEELLRTIHQQLSTLMDTSNFYVALYDEQTDRYTFPYVVDEFEAGASFSPVQMRRSFTDYVRRTGAPLLVDEEIHRQLVERGEAELVGVQSPIWLGAPLKTARGAVGVVVVQNYSDRAAYTSRDLELLAFVSDHLALAIERKRALDAERVQLQLAQTLQEVGALLTTQMSLEEVYERLFDLLARVVAYDSVSVQLLDEDGQLYLAAGRGFPDRDQARQFARRISREDIRMRWGQRRAMVIPDARHDSRWIKAPGDEYICSWIGAALRTKGRLIGVLNVDSRTANAYDEAQAETVIAFANQAAVAIENARLFQAEREQRELGEALRVSGHVLSTNLNFNAVLDHLLEQIGRVVPYDSGNVMLVDDGRTHTARLRGYEQFGAELAEAVRRLSFEVAATPNLRRMAETGQPLIISDVAADPEWIANPAAIHVRSWAGAPILVEGRPIAFFSLDKTEPNYYRREHAERLGAFVSQAALALENARLFTESQRRETELATLLEVSRAVSSSLRLDEVLRVVAMYLARTLDVERCVLSAYEPDADRVRTLAAYLGSGKPHAVPPGQDYRLADYPVTRQVIENGEAVVIRADDPAADPAEVSVLRQEGVAAVLMAPLRAGGQTVGLAELYTRDSARQFSLGDLRLGRALADQAGAAIRNARLYKAAQEELAERRRAEAQAARTARQLAALSHMGQTVAASLDMAEVLEMVSQEVLPLLGAEGISILLLSGPAELIFSAVHGAGTPGLVGQRIPAAGSVAGEVVRTGRSVLVSAADEPARIYRDIERISGFHTQDLLAVPLSLENETIGVMEAVHSQAGAFDAEHLRLLESAALWASIAIGNARRHESTQRLLRESEAMAAINRALNETLDLGRILKLIVDSAERVIPSVERAVIHLVDETRQALIPAAAAGLEAQLGEPEFTMRPGEGIAGRAVVEGRVINVGDTLADPRFLRLGRAAHLRSLLVAPVSSGSRRLGAISVQSAAARAFSADDERLLATLAGQAALAIDNARYFETERRRAEEAEALQRVTQTLIRRRQLADLLAGVAEAIAKVANCQHVGVFLVPDSPVAPARPAPQADDGSDAEHAGSPLAAPALELVARHGAPELGAGASSLVQGLAANVMRTGQPALVKNLGWSGEERPMAAGGSAIAVPLIRGETRLGVLLVRSDAGRVLDNGDLDWLTNVGRQVSVAIENVQLYADLERALQQEQATRAQLVQSEKLAAMGRLVASVAHELNNPLQAIQNALYLVGQEGLLSAQSRDDLEVALAEADRMAGLIGRLRETYRPATAEQFGPASLDVIVAEVHKLIATHLRHNNVVFSFEPDPLAPRVHGIHDQLKQVLLNLCLNAVEAMPGGGRLTVAMCPAAGEVLVSVADTGVGIDTGALPNVFDPFYTTKAGGTGLGLAITYDIIRRHNGRIEVESQLGRGTTFKLWLPEWTGRDDIGPGAGN